VTTYIFQNLEIDMSRSLALVACCLLFLSGCYYESESDDVYFRVEVSAEADHPTAFVGMTVELSSYYVTDHASVYITTHDWTVVSHPAGATYILDDYGRDASLLPLSPGTYVVRYRTWYYTNHDYEDCDCTTATGYREDFVTITVVPAPSA
jgi:hypothetical protein